MVRENEHEKKFKECTGMELTECFKKYRLKLRWQLFKYTGDESVAEDFVQQAFLQAMEKIDTFDEDKAQFFTWLTRIATNFVIRDYNERQRLGLVSLDKVLSNDSSLIDYVGDTNYGIEEEKHQTNKKKADIVVDVISKLPDKYKKVMMLREVYKKPYKEIAEIIKKEDNFQILNEVVQLPKPEDFYELNILNEGDTNIIFHISSFDSTNEYRVVVEPSEYISISRDDILWTRKSTDICTVHALNGRAVLKYIITTNLSTVKSQIRKGRNLIMKKVKRHFDDINKNGLV